MNLGDFKGIIFDYDGVIANSDIFNKKALILAALKVGLNFLDDDFENYFAGKTLYDGAKDYLEVYKKGEEFKKFIKNKKSFDSEYKKEVIPFKKTLEFIRANTDEYKMCIASGSRRVLIKAFVEKFELEDTFEFIITAEDYKKGKPAPDAYLMAVDQMDLPTEDLIVIEDAPKGVRAAKEAGLKCLAVSHTHKREDLQEADWIIENLGEK
jgi:beta-phosphoglucomutase